jgi:hypothetical protein
MFLLYQRDNQKSARLEGASLVGFSTRYCRQFHHIVKGLCLLFLSLSDWFL